MPTRQKWLFWLGVGTLGAMGVLYGIGKVRQGRLEMDNEAEQESDEGDEETDELDEESESGDVEADEEE